MSYDNALPIPNYETYRVDSNGNVYNKRGHILKQEISNNGYSRVSLSKHQKHKKFLVHRLVADAFCDNPSNFPQVHHKDENKLNNQYDNLEWCNCLYNLLQSDVINKASIAKFTQVRCKNTGEVFNSIKEACIKYNLEHSNVVACCNGRRKHTRGLQWEYY